jgi:hypothetical protein
MKQKHQFLTPRQDVIYAVTERMLRETATNRRTFAMEVADRYLQTTAEDDRSLPFRITYGGCGESDKKHNGQILGRYLDGTVKTLPADLEDAWVTALPQPYRDTCEQELAARRGMLAVAMPKADLSQVASVSDLCKEFAELMAAIAPALENGTFGPEDFKHAGRIQREGRETIAAILALMNEVERKVFPGEAP